jgi:hypothetical protein
MRMPVPSRTEFRNKKHMLTVPIGVNFLASHTPYGVMQCLSHVTLLLLFFVDEAVYLF